MSTQIIMSSGKTINKHVDMFIRHSRVSIQFHIPSMLCYFRLDWPDRGLSRVNSTMAWLKRGKGLYNFE